MNGATQSDPLKLLFENSPDAIWMFDVQQGVFVDCNAAALAMMRAKEKSQVLQTRPTHFAPEIQPNGRRSEELEIETIQQVQRDGSARFDWLAHRLDGELFHVEVVITKVRDGNREMHFIICREITERKEADTQIRELNHQLEMRIRERTVELVQTNEHLKAEIRERRRKEQLLQESEARARTLVENAPEAIVVYDKDTGKFIDANKNALTLFGISREMLLQLGPHNLSPVVQPDGRFSEEAAREKLDEVLANGEAVFEWTHRSATGGLIPCEVRLVRYPSKERNLIRGSITNISERKRSDLALRESEEKFRALFEASSQGVMLHDDEQFLEVNPAAVRIMGYDDASELVGKHPAEISAPIQANGQPAEELARQHIHDCMSKGTARFEWTGRSKNGRELPFEIFLTRIPMGGRQLIQAVINDISERKQAEAELLKALAREKELSQLKTNFVSTVSHEFRTPLGIIMSSSQILADYFGQLSAGEREEHLLSITRNTRHMARLMEEVLLLSRVDSGKMVCEVKSLDLRSFCTRLIDEALSATNKQCPIRLTLPENLAEAHADERLLRYIFTNLLSNAVKYSAPGTPVDFIVERDGKDAVCKVRDRGIGIPEADRAWLFSAFHRGRNVGERHGTGLGLTIVKSCVDLHNGQIKVDSAVGSGTTVTVRLPVFD